MPHTIKSPRLELPTEIVAQMRHAIACFANGTGDSFGLLNALKRVDSSATVPRPADSDMARAFRTLWRATPRRRTITDGQWDAECRYVEAQCFSPTFSIAVPLTLTNVPEREAQS